MSIITSTSLPCQYSGTVSDHDILAFLQAVHGDSPICFQTFNDDKNSTDKSLATNFHRVAQRSVIAELRAMNARGAGIYHTVNETDGNGRKANNIVAINALFCDYDKVDPKNLDKLPPPSASVRSKNGLHLYWLLIPGQDINKFTAYQSMLAELTGGDLVVKDLPRVMRLPGFNHLKDPNDPFHVQLQELHPERRYSLADFPTPDTKVLKASKKQASSTPSKLPMGLEGLISAVVEYRNITHPKGLKPDREGLLEKKLYKALRAVPLGKGADNAILRASKRCAELLLRTEDDIELVVAKVLGWVSSVYAAQESPSVTWNASKAHNTIVNGLRYGCIEKLQQLQPEDLTIRNAKLVNSQYVSDLGIDYKSAKITAIASPIGTGKTTYIQKLIEDAIKNNPAASIRIFTHRTALVAAWASVVPGAILYNDQVALKDIHNVHSIHAYIGTYDSLARFANGSLPSSDTLLILDEADQAFHYLFTCKETSIANTRKSCYDALRLLCQRAAHVIATSATLSQLEVDVLCHLAKWGNEPVTCQIYVNQCAPHKKTFHKVSSEADAVALAAKFLGEGKKVYIATDSSTKAETYREEVNKYQPDKTYAVITAESKLHYDLVNINQTVKEFDCVIASPTLGTGIDINCKHFDVAILIGTNGSDIGYDSLLQAIGRVRTPLTGDVYCYVNEAFRWFETDIEVLKELYDIGQEGISAFVFEIHLSEWSKEQLVVNTHTDLAFIQQTTADYLAKEARAKVARSSKFWSVVRSSGHDVVDYEEPTHLVDEVGEPLIDGSSLYWSRDSVVSKKMEDIADAAVISEESVNHIRRKMEMGERVTKAQTNSVSRYFVSKALYPDEHGEAAVFADQVAWYNSKGRACIHTLKMMSIPALEAFKSDVTDFKTNEEDGGYDAKFYLRSRHNLLALYEAVRPFFNQDRPSYDIDSIDTFTDTVEQIGIDNVRKLGIKVDMSKPCTAVGSFLRLLGYDVQCVRGGAGRVLGYLIWNDGITNLLHALHKPEGDKLWLEAPARTA